MIKVTRKTTELEGTKIELLSEFCSLVHHLVTKDEDADEAVFTREELDECIRLATLSSDELHRKAMSAFIDVISKLGIL